MDTTRLSEARADTVRIRFSEARTDAIRLRAGPPASPARRSATPSPNRHVRQDADAPDSATPSPNRHVRQDADDADTAVVRAPRPALVPLAAVTARSSSASSTRHPAARRRASRRTPRRTPRRGPWRAILLSLVVAAALLVATAYVPDWVSRSPQPAPVANTAGPDDTQRVTARRQADLVAAEDDRLVAKLRAIPWGVAPYLDRSGGTTTAVLPTRSAPYDLPDLISLRAARRVDPGTVELLTSVLVAPGARLVLDAPGTVLRMTSSPAGFVSVVGSRGSVELAGRPGQPMRVTSWDPAASAPDRDPADGRSYIRVVGADLRSRFTDLSNLGFWSGRTGGLAVGGSDTTRGTGSVTDTSVAEGQYGLFSSDTTGLTVTRSRFEANAADGVLLHRGTQGAVVSASSARFNRGQGMVADQGSSASVFSGVVVERNDGPGVFLDGRALADRSGPSGASLDPYRGFRVEKSTSRGNLGGGIVADETVDAAIVDNRVSGDGDGVLVRGAARNVAVSGNEITAGETGVQVRDGGDEILVDRNTVLGTATGVQVRDARVAVQSNAIRAARLHGVSVQGASNGSAASDNALAGAGPSALDLYRLEAGAAVSVLGNDEEQWQVTQSLRQQAVDLIRDHPLLLMWMLVLVIPVASVLGRRRRRKRRTGPYPAHRRPSGPAPAHDGRTGLEPAAQASTPESDTRLSVVGAR